MLVTLLAACCYSWETGAASSSFDGGGAGSSSGADGGPSCEELADDLDKKRVAAKSCVAMCTASIVDECACKSYVAQGGSTSANAFAAAVQAFTGAGCARACDACALDLVDAGACTWDAPLAKLVCSP